MNICKILLTLTVSVGLLTSCVRKKEAQVDTAPAAKVVAMPKKVVTTPQEKSLNLFIRVMEQADSVHREAWWVLTGERRPLQKSSFGKVQRALMTQQNAKLGNKSLFSCDRYEVKRDVMSQTGYPQKIEMYERCSSKAPAKRMAMINAQKEGEFDLTLFPEGLQEVLGISAAILNATVTCKVRANADEQLLSLSCKNWAQEKDRVQMIRLDVYDYEKEGQNMIKLRGKIFENLTDVRKIVADVPMSGKITVTETELYAPTPSPTPKKSPTPQKSPVADGQQPPADGEPQAQVTPKPSTPSGPVSVPMDQPTVQLPGGVIGGEGQSASDAAPNPAAQQGWPTDENGNVIENPQPIDNEADPSQQQEQHQDPQNPQQAAPEHPGILNDQGAPSGR